MKDQEQINQLKGDYGGIFSEEEIELLNHIRIMFQEILQQGRGFNSVIDKVRGYMLPVIKHNRNKLKCNIDAPLTIRSSRCGEQRRL